ncbi:ABC transporter ATP-binding protein [Synoicihabitans lomoniglobus]|uniref:ABC transporter ATP-binding protein n=1 Tax=Synoicihabitans lomoniglobus TaxID=2909285 RepID=A0AAF0CHR8_9BACT|nr:ABC transporter ATP-binding protein/permease [Opitutaceae bacterium LMO-M01]WED64607.1 ABC transporter ATP-binding protein [Opitutaceae bacterium LMO-M01]
MKTENPFRRVSRYLLRYRGLFVLTLTLAVGSTLFLVSIPQVIKWIVDDVIGAGRKDLLIWGVAALTGCYFLRDLLNSLRIRVNNTLEQKVLVDLRGDLHSRLLDLPVGYYDQRQTGEIASRVIEDVQNVERALLDGTEQGTVSLLTLFGISTILFVQQPLLAALVLAPLPIVIFMGRMHFKAGRVLWKRTREAAGDLNGLLMENISGHRLISSFSLADRERGRFKTAAHRLRDTTLAAMFRWSLHGPGTNFISSLGAVAVMGVGGALLMESNATGGAFSLGDFISFFAYCTLVYEPVSRLNQLNQMLAAARASSDRVFEILDHPIAIQSPAEPQPFPASVPEVRYENVSYGYPDRPPVLKDFSLTLPAGKVTALVGHTGAGKTTLANLLLRYYDVTGGSVSIGGTDVRQLDLSALREQIGLVAQEPFLFNGTVAENLRLARAAATDEELVAALQAAAAWEFVHALPEAMETEIGERGVRLSQGEKQRLTIARVILRNPPLVILDEATASVDTITENAIQQALATLVEERTTLVIAHRLSTVRRADQIVVLAHGRIVEKGTHDDLLGRDGAYAKLWRAQAQADQHAFESLSEL